MRGSQEEIRANGWETMRLMTCNQWNRNFEIQSLAMRNEGKIIQEFLEVVKLESWKTRIAEGHVSCAKAARSIQGSCRSAWGTDNRITRFSKLLCAAHHFIVYLVYMWKAIQISRGKCSGLLMADSTSELPTPWQVQILQASSSSSSLSCSPFFAK